MRRLPELLAVLVAIATALLILAASVTPFLSPSWVAFEQERADAAGWTGFNPVDLRHATDAILSDLVIGPPNFDVLVAGEPVLKEAERGHMRDVRQVFIAFYVLAGAGLVLVVLGRLAARASSGWSRTRFLRAVRAGAIGLGIGIAAAGIIAGVAFDAAFELFHRLFFSAGTYNFDPRTDRLVQLFPEAFWSDTTIAVGLLTLLIALLVVIESSRWLRGEQRQLRARAAVDAG